MTRDDSVAPMLVVFSGVPGSGKSALADALSRRLHLPVFSVDPIEAALLRAGVAQSFATGLAAYLVVEALVDAQLGRAQGAIVDAVNAVEPAKDMWRRMAVKHDVSLKVVLCDCSNPTLHRARLEGRERGLAPLPEPTWETAQQRRAELTAWSEPHLSVDTVLPIAENIVRIMAWLQT